MFLIDMPLTQRPLQSMNLEFQSVRNFFDFSSLTVSGRAVSPRKGGATANSLKLGPVAEWLRGVLDAS